MEVHFTCTQRNSPPEGPCQICGKPGHVYTGAPDAKSLESGTDRVQVLCTECRAVQTDADLVGNLQNMKQRIAHEPEGSKEHIFWSGMIEHSEMLLKRIRRKKAAGVPDGATAAEDAQAQNELIAWDVRLRELFDAYVADDRNPSH